MPFDLKALTKNKPVLFGTVGAAGVVGYYVIKKNKAASTVASVPTDTSATDLSSSDYANDGYSAIPSSLSGYTDPGTGAFIGTGQNTVISAPTNGAWVQQCAAYLGQNGYDPSTVISALGLYLSDGNLTADQVSIVNAAIGAEGAPPQPPPHPPHSAPSTGQTGTAPAAAVAQAAKLRAAYDSVEGQVRNQNNHMHHPATAADNAALARLQGAASQAQQAYFAYADANHIPR